VVVVVVGLGHMRLWVVSSVDLLDTLVVVVVVVGLGHMRLW